MGLMSGGYWRDVRHPFSTVTALPLALHIPPAGWTAFAAIGGAVVGAVASPIGHCDFTGHEPRSCLRQLAVPPFVQPTLTQPATSCRPEIRSLRLGATAPPSVATIPRSDL